MVSIMIKALYSPIGLLHILLIGLGLVGCTSEGLPTDVGAQVDTYTPDPFVRGQAPPSEGIYSYASGCYAVEAFDGDRTVKHLAVTADGTGYAFDADTLNDAARFHMRATDLGIYLLYDTENNYVSAVSTAAGEIRFERPSTLESKVDVLDLSFRSPAEWILEISSRDPERFQFKHYATGRYLTLTGLTDDAADAAVIALYPQEGCAEFPELTLDAVGTIQPKVWDDGDVYGIAEIHSHMMADSGFGGAGIFHGAPFHRLGVERALPDCDRSHGPEGRRDLIGFFYDNKTGFDIDILLPAVAEGEFEEFNHFTAGYPDFIDWPNSWNKATHQTMYYRWVERAYLAGLRLLVQHATGNSVLCELTVGTGAQQTLYSCNDMVSVDQAIQQAHDLERYVDAQSGGPGKGWFRVVDSPEHAREVINEGKLAVVLGIEISNLFDCFVTPKPGFETCTEETVKEKLDHYYGMGVRMIFPVHKYDNAFSPGDGSNNMIELGNFVNSGHYSNFVEDCPTYKTAFDGGGVTFGGLNKPRDVYDAPPAVDMSGFQDDIVGTLLPFYSVLMAPSLQGNYCQKHNLTALGEFLIHELMARGIMIDVAHLPQRALERTLEILEANDYPATKTHGDGVGGRIYGLGGLVGTRLGRCGKPDKPGEMGVPLADSVATAIANGAYPSDGLSFDLNGFAGGPRPRFGDNKACGAEQTNPITYPFTSYDGNITFTPPMLGNRPVDFNQEGMIHIGLLPELIEDVRRDGTTDAELEPLFRSAEAFIRMWEKAENWTAP